MLLMCIALSLQVTATPDSAYSSESVRRIVLATAERNRLVPATLASYRADVQSEVALLRRADGEEHVSRLEQVALRVDWNRFGSYTEHVVGHRAVSSGIPLYDALKVPSFTIPTLYGNRFSLLLGPYGADETAPQRGSPDDLAEVHPLAPGADRIYRYSGDDRLQRIVAGGNLVLVRTIHVRPVARPWRRTTVFAGDLFIDADSDALVGMRGEIREIGGHASLLSNAASALITDVGFVEVASARVEGGFWVPFEERIELRASSPLARRDAFVLRISSRFAHYEIVSSPPSFSVDTLIAEPRRLTIAGGDSLARFSDWRLSLGSATDPDAFSGLAALTPLRVASGEPVVDDPAHRAPVRFGTRAFADALRFNRVEGLFTGFGIEASQASGGADWSEYLTGGRAWSERAWRGHAVVARRSARWAVGARAGRLLLSTNDFVPDREQFATLAALAGVDNYDYVDRREAAAFIGLPLGEHLALAADAGAADDRRATRALSHGLVIRNPGFRDNRPVTDARYPHGTITLSANPGVVASYLSPGAGGMIRVEQASGAHGFTRVEGRIVARAFLPGGLIIGARLDAGTVEAPDSIPLQQMFELGGPEQLPGFAYKEFAGNRAVLLRADASAPFLPWRWLGLDRHAITARFEPRLAGNVHSGAAWSTSRQGVDAASALLRWAGECPPGAPCATASGKQTSVTAGLRFLDNGLFVGVARRVTRRDRWRGVIMLGAILRCGAASRALPAARSSARRSCSGFSPGTPSCLRASRPRSPGRSISIRWTSSGRMDGSIVARRPSPCCSGASTPRVTTSASCARAPHETGA